MENEQKVYGNMQKNRKFFPVGKPPFLDPMGAREVSKGDPYRIKILMSSNYKISSVSMDLAHSDLEKKNAIVNYWYLNFNV